VKAAAVARQIVRAAAENFILKSVFLWLNKIGIERQLFNKIAMISTRRKTELKRVILDVASEHVVGRRELMVKTHEYEL
jgi:hypothetical protein